MICPRCGYSNAPTDESCGRCGNTLLPGGSFVQERRWVSSVFFDLSRFTEYALAHPLEDTWQAVNTALQAASNHVRFFGGHIDKFFGDGFLAVFGVPRSQESDAKAALEAAKAMVSGSPLPGRAGVASGLVLRTPLGGGLAGDQTVLGPAVNLSQRLSQAAPPGEVWCDGTTMRLVALADCEPQQPQPLKGYAEPLIPFRYLGLKAGPAQVLGREGELEVLWHALSEVRKQRGRRVVIHGPMGVGKSHLVQAFVGSLPRDVRGVVAPRLTTGVALRYALRQGLQELMSEGLAALRQLSLSEELREILAFSIGLEEHPGLPSNELDALLVETWWQLLERLAQEQPLVVVLEDLHNADPTVLEFSRRPAPPGVLLVLVSRQNRWDISEDLISLALEPLSLSDTQQLVLIARPDLGPATSLHLAEASGGYPLAVHALSLTPSGEPEPIPLYQPRLDSLPRLARVALQAAAVLGPTSPPELIRHLVGQEADLTRLVGEGFLEADEQGQLRFAIPWLREATLGQVAAQQGQQWHLQAARWYQRQERLSEAATQLEAAGELASAYRMWRVVAQQAWNQDQHGEAIVAYLEAMRLAEGNVRMSAALEVAEAYLSLGRYHEALELANLPLEQTEIPQSTRERAWAICVEAALELGQFDDTPLPSGFEPVEPRLRLAVSRRLKPKEARILLAHMPPNLEGMALLVRAAAWLKSGDLIQAEALSQMYLDEYSGNPAQIFKAHSLLVECLWRQFRLQDARSALGEPPTGLPQWFGALHKAQKALLLLELGDIKGAGEELRTALEQVQDGPPMAFEQVAAVQLRYLLESGQLHQAAQFGEAAVARVPSPSLLAHLSLAYALSPDPAHRPMLTRLLRGLEDNLEPEVQALRHIALGIQHWEEADLAKQSLLKAVWFSRKAQHPSSFFYALLMLSLLHSMEAPKKALALAQYLLSQTASRGFLAHIAFSRLLRAQLLLDEGREPLKLLEFEPAMPLAKLWRKVLLRISEHKGGPLPKASLRQHGLKAIWRQWFGQPKTTAPKTPLSKPSSAD